MTKPIMVIALLALEAMPCMAVIGATEEECRRKYAGKVTTANVEPLADKTLIWKDGKKEVLIVFLEGRAHYIIHMRTGGAKFKDTDLREIMKDNGDGQRWTEVEGLPHPGWLRADRQIMLTRHARLNGYTLATSKWIELKKRKGRATPR